MTATGSTTTSREALRQPAARPRPRGGTGMGQAGPPPRTAQRQARPRLAPDPRIQRPAARPAAVAARPASMTTAVPRAPFVLLVLALLGGGLICLLVINTTLGATSFQIDRLQQSANASTRQADELQQQLATDRSDARIEQEACSLGMRPQQQLEFLDLRTHRVQASGSVVATPAWCRR